MRKLHSPSNASAILGQARNAIRRDPALRGALTDPAMVAAADGVIATMRDAGTIPTALNVLAHLTDAGFDERRAAILAAIAETRLAAPT